MKFSRRLFGSVRRARPLSVVLPVPSAFALAVVWMLVACGGIHGEADSPDTLLPPPPAGRYAFARSASRLLAIPLDGQWPAPVSVASLRSEPDFALPVERLSGPEHSGSRHHDLLLFNGGDVYWLSGVSNGVDAVARKLTVPGFVVHACGHTVQPDDPAVQFVRERQNGAIVEVAVHFIGSTGCIDAAGDMTLSVPVLLGGKASVVHARGELRIGVQANGSALGTLRLGNRDLVYTPAVDGAGRHLSISPSEEDASRIVAWQFLARDAQGALLCGSIDGVGRCALYYFDPQASPQLTKLSPDDFAAVQLAGIGSGRAYVVSRGPIKTGQPNFAAAVHEFTIGQPPSSRAAVTLAPQFRTISLDQSVLFYVEDTVRYSQYRLVDAATGQVWDTDFVTYGSGASSTHADQRMGCVVSGTRLASIEWSGCVTQAWLTPNTTSGVRDRTVYLRNSAGTVTNSWVIPDVANAAGFVGYETASHLLIGVKRGDGSGQIWRTAPARSGSLELLAAGNVVLYGSIRPRGSVL